MTHLKRWFLILLTSGLAVSLLITALAVLPAFAQGPGGMMRGFGFDNDGYGPGWGHSGGMMGGYGYNNTQPGAYGPGRMMAYTQGYTNTRPFGFGPGWMHGGFGPRGMMGRGFAPRWWGSSQEESETPAYGYGCPGMGGVGRWGSNSPFFNSEPLSLAATRDAVNSFLAELNEANLELGEVMIFDNHAYAQIVEKDSGIGAMEVLIDPTTKAIYPEMGPNMMWNLKYGMMAGYGAGGRFGWQEPPAEMAVTPAEAVEAAQAYLDAHVGDNLVAGDHADPFYGYYTLHVNRAGETIGMLSVNGFTRQVFLHNWHGELLEMSGE